MRRLKREGLPYLPRELSDQIIEAMIECHAHDPAYQWAVLRHITKPHRKQIEQHFRVHWLPKLIISVHHDDNGYADYRAFSVDRETGLVAKFKLRDLSAEWNTRVYVFRWEQSIAMSDFDRPNIHVRLGVGAMNDGLANSWIISDTFLPGLRWGDYGRTIWFEWKKLFDILFGEEIIMRKAQKIMVRYRFYIKLPTFSIL